MPRRKKEKKRRNHRCKNKKSSSLPTNLCRMEDPDPLILNRVLRDARVIWGEKETITSKKSLALEVRRFTEFFGCNPRVAASLWSLLLTHTLVPKGGTIAKLLWTLLFMKEYSPTEALCNIVGVKSPKTFRLFVWAFIDSISMLESELVSLFDFSFKNEDYCTILNDIFIILFYFD